MASVSGSEGLAPHYTLQRVKVQAPISTGLRLSHTIFHGVDWFKAIKLSLSKSFVLLSWSFGQREQAFVVIVVGLHSLAFSAALSAPSL